MLHHHHHVALIALILLLQDHRHFLMDGRIQISDKVPGRRPPRIGDRKDQEHQIRLHQEVADRLARGLSEGPDTRRIDHVEVQ